MPEGVQEEDDVWDKYYGYKACWGAITSAPSTNPYAAAG